MPEYTENEVTSIYNKGVSTGHSMGYNEGHTEGFNYAKNKFHNKSLWKTIVLWYKAKDYR